MKIRDRNPNKVVLKPERTSYVPFLFLFLFPFWLCNPSTPALEQDVTGEDRPDDGLALITIGQRVCKQRVAFIST